MVNRSAENNVIVKLNKIVLVVSNVQIYVLLIFTTHTLHSFFKQVEVIIKARITDSNLYQKVFELLNSVDNLHVLACYFKLKFIS